VPQREEAPIGAPCWIDLFTSDPDKSRSFYGELFGWTSQEAGAEYGGYINFSKDGLPVAGAMRDADGGQVLVPAMDVGEQGTMALVTDAGGAAIGIWQPGVHRGFGIHGEPGTPAWFELFTRDYDASVEFYRQVFGWDTHVAGDTPEFRYTTLGEGESQLAGIMDATAFLPEGVPAHWSIYFGVEDADAALAKIVELGGSVVRPAEDTPYGRLAEAADPTGAHFKLIQPPTS
jgi:predicted enzyme related to lactoylglutathione lyase